MKKKLVEKKFGRKKNLAEKKIWPKKKLAEKKFWLKKNFGWKKNLAEKNLAGKNIGWNIGCHTHRATPWYTHGFLKKKNDNI